MAEGIFSWRKRKKVTTGLYFEINTRLQEGPVIGSSPISSDVG